MARRSDHRHRRWPVPSWAVAGATLLVAAGAIWLGLARLGTLGTALAGATAMAAGFGLGLALIRRLLGGPSGIAGVARAVVDEAVRMRSTLVLLILLVGLVPVLPLLLDPAERLAYRVQFLISWALGATSLILGFLTIFLACGSVCGDIDSGRIHMTLSKPLHRWEYLLGKWLGIVLYDLLLVVVAGGGAYTLVRMLAAGPAIDAADREAVDRQVLVARRKVAPEPDNPQEYAAAIAAAIARLEADSPEFFATQPAATRRRIESEYRRQWHTVTPDMETTFVFRRLGTQGRADAEVQLEVEPRVTNVDVDLAEVRFALWLNGRPWPRANGVQVEETLPSRARHVFDLPAEPVAESDELRVRVANRNLVPPGETRPTAISFAPGDGLRVLVRTGGFEANFIRCLVLLWGKLALVAAAGVAAGAMFDLPSAILATLVLAAGALGSEFFRDALGTYNVVGESAWGRVADRMALAAGSLREQQFYEAFRMLLGFVTDFVLWLLPSLTSDAAIRRLATGITIPWPDVLTRLSLLCIVYPFALGAIAWLVFDRRDLVRSSS